MWLDNFYKPRYVCNLAVGNASMNGTLMAVLHVLPVTPSSGLPVVRKLYRRRPWVASL